MKRLLCPKLPTASHSVQLSESEAHHAVRVLRMRDGDEIEALDGKGGAIRAKLIHRGDHVRIEYVGEPHTPKALATCPIILEAAVLKGDAMQWLVEKAVELGVQEFIPVLTAHTVVQLKNKGPEAFQERWRKWADQALKQCGRLDAMKIHSPIELEILLSQNPGTAEKPRLWCDEKSTRNAPHLAAWCESHRGVAPRILIGPEGGWSEPERDLLSRSESFHVEKVSLGPLILRAETASLYCVSILTAFWLTFPS